MLAKLTTLVDAPSTSGAGGCKKCGGEAHKGGYKNCPFKNLSDLEAKQRVGQLMKALGKMSAADAARILANESPSTE
jgi:hypothetical protein